MPLYRVGRPSFHARFTPHTLHIPPPPSLPPLPGALTRPTEGGSPPAFSVLFVRPPPGVGNAPTSAPPPYRDVANSALCRTRTYLTLPHCVGRKWRRADGSSDTVGRSNRRTSPFHVLPLLYARVRTVYTLGYAIAFTRTHLHIATPTYTTAPHRTAHHTPTTVTRMDSTLPCLSTVCHCVDYTHFTSVSFRHIMMKRKYSAKISDGHDCVAPLREYF